MNAALAKYCRHLPATRQLRQMQLAECLYRLGVKPTSGRSLNVRKMNEWELADLFKSAQQLFRKMVAMLHPDRGGSNTLCSKLNALWVRIKTLFRRKGVET